MLTNRSMLHQILIILISLLACLIAILAHNDFWSNILLPLNSLVAGGILLFCFIKSNYKNYSFFSYSIACFAWGLGDSLWVVWEFLGKDPATSPVLCSIYFVTNCCFILGLFLFSLRQYYTKWTNVQLYMDALFIGFMSLMLIWMIFLHKDVSIIIRMMDSAYTSVLSIIIDVILFMGVLSFLFSVRSERIAPFLKLTACGLLLFCFVDSYYFYADIHHIYIPNSLCDFACILSLQMIASGALCRTYACRGSTVTFSDFTNIGTNKRWIFLFLYPLLAIVLALFDIDVNVSAADIVMLVFFVFFYRVACKYIQISIENERLLEQAKRTNELLELRVAEQVAELTFLMNQDTLTTLFNRRYFLSCMDESISTLSAGDTLALLLIDVDRFKTINDDFGHDVGDKVLIDLSYRMIQWNNHGAILSRLGGDEFAILLVGKYSRKEIQNYCLEIMTSFNEPIYVGNNTLTMTISVGIALHSPDACDSKTLMKHADISMYRAKAQGYNKYQFYDPLLSEDINRNRKIENMLKQTDVEKDFELFFQPQFSLPDKKLIGAEALIRWNHPEHGYIPPNIFIPVAEEIDKIFKIGKWVMQETIRQVVAWNQRYHVDLKVGFNVSTKQFDDDGFIPLLKSLILDAGVHTEWLDAEITESVMINDGHKVNEILGVLNELGLSVSIDDFGAGYSSLSYLNKYHFDRIKIDKSLIDQVSLDHVSGINIVKAAISMAKAVGIKTIAEGVETQEQFAILTELGCDEVQGYLLGRPVPADVFEDRFLCLVD